MCKFLSKLFKKKVNSIPPQPTPIVPITKPKPPVTTDDSSKITIDLNISSGGGGFVTLTNQSTSVEYIISAADATGVGELPVGYYNVTGYGLNTPCNSPLYINVTPMIFESLSPATIIIQVTCV